HRAIAKTPDLSWIQLLRAAPASLESGLDFKNPWMAAESNFRSALQLEPEHYFTYLFLADTLLHNDKSQESDLVVNACIGLRPAYELGYLLRAVVCLKQEQQSH